MTFSYIYYASRLIGCLRRNFQRARDRKRQLLLIFITNLCSENNQQKRIVEFTNILTRKITNNNFRISQARNYAPKKFLEIYWENEYSELHMPENDNQKIRETLHPVKQYMEL